MEVLTTVEYAESITHLSWSNDGENIAIVRGGHVSIYLPFDPAIPQVHITFNQPVSFVAWQPQDLLLALVLADGTFWLWDVKGQRLSQDNNMTDVAWIAWTGQGIDCFVVTKQLASLVLLRPDSDEARTHCDMPEDLMGVLPDLWYAFPHAIVRIRNNVLHTWELSGRLVGSVSLPTQDIQAMSIIGKHVVVCNADVTYVRYSNPHRYSDMAHTAPVVSWDCQQPQQLTGITTESTVLRITQHRQGMPQMQVSNLPVLATLCVYHPRQRVLACAYKNRIHILRYVR